MNDNKLQKAARMGEDRTRITNGKFVNNYTW